MRLSTNIVFSDLNESLFNLCGNRLNTLYILLYSWYIAIIAPKTERKSKARAIACFRLSGDTYYNVTFEIRKFLPANRTLYGCSSSTKRLWFFESENPFAAVRLILCREVYNFDLYVFNCTSADGINLGRVPLTAASRTLTAECIYYNMKYNIIHEIENVFCRRQ